MKRKSDTQVEAAKCPDCGTAMAEGQYCAEDNAVATKDEATASCPGCSKEFKSGEYCEECNNFVFNEDAACQCGHQMRKGEWCSECQTYAGLPNVAYCQDCETAHNKAEGCPVCGT